MMTTETSDHAFRKGNTLYTLRESEIGIVQALFEALQQLNQKQRENLAVALRRFNQTYTRDNDEDKIIDLTIALESCLLGEDDELSYRFALRGAALLAEMWDPSEARSLLKAMYAIRSAIVHRGQQLSNLGNEYKRILRKLDIKPKDFPQHCENITRDILKTYVARLANDQSEDNQPEVNEPVKKVIQDLEEQIVQGLAPKR